MIYPLVQYSMNYISCSCQQSINLVGLHYVKVRLFLSECDPIPKNDCNYYTTEI